MPWTHVANTNPGIQVTSPTQSSLVQTFSGTIANGSLIIVSVAWGNPGIAGAPTVKDSVNSVNYTLVDVSTQQGFNVYTFYYLAPTGAPVLP